MSSSSRFTSCRTSLSTPARIAQCSALCLALLLPDLTTAAALGEITVRSSLGQALDADIALASLSAGDADSLMVRLAPAAAFTEAGIDYTPLLRSLHLAVEKRGSLHVVRLRSDLPVSDPFVRLLVELNTNGSRMIRDYTVLIDPPLLEAGENRAVRAPLADKESQAGPVRDDTLHRPAASSQLSEKADYAAPPQTGRDASAVGTRIVRRGETLRSIAAAIQPENTRIEQVLVALQSTNPSAFVDGNINRLRQGSVLRLPAEEAIRAMDPDKARRALRIQSQQFSRYQQLLAQRGKKSGSPGGASALQSAGNRSSGGQVGLSAAIPPSVIPERDRLILSTPGAADQAAGSVRSADAVDKIANDKAIAEANSRIAALEKNISQLQQLLTLRNGKMADAQQEAAQSANDASPDNTLAAQPKAALSATAPVATSHLSADPQTHAASDTEAMPESAAADQAPIRALPVTPPPPAPPAVSVPAKPAPATGTLTNFLADSLTPGAALAALLLAMWGALRWRGRTRSEKQAVEPVLAERAVIADAGGRHVDTRHSEFHSNFVPSVSQIHANEVDAVAEADVYIAYGRDEQAEEILLDALRTHPQRHALRVKLLEIYVARQDRQKFGTLAAELRVLTHGVGSDWEEAAQLGSHFDPGNRLFESAAEASRSGVAEVAVTSPGSAMQPLPSGDFGLHLDGLPGESRETDSVPAAPLPMQDMSAAKGIDFSLSGIDAKPSTPPTSASADAAALTTKLELAIACQEFGDRDGAHELLSEVAKSGHPDLARRAQSLLSQLA